MLLTSYESHGFTNNYNNDIQNCYLKTEYFQRPSTPPFPQKTPRTKIDTCGCVLLGEINNFVKDTKISTDFICTSRI